MNYLIKTNTGKKVFTYRPYEGICMIEEGLRSQKAPTPICREGSNIFFVYKDGEGVIHLITVGKNSKLIYMICKEEWRSYELGTIKEGVEVKNIVIGVNDLGQNLFYSAKYLDEYILVHCVLGDKAMPSTVAKMNSEEFFVAETRVYYTDTQNRLGYSDFSDGKPDTFNVVTRGKSPYLLKSGACEYLVYKEDDKIFVNEKCYVENEQCEKPIMVKSKDSFFLMWKSGDFIRYIPYDNRQLKLKPIQYLSGGVAPDIYALSNGHECRFYIGILSENKLRILSGADPYSVEEEYRKERESIRKREHILGMKRQLEELQAEIADYRNQIQKLNAIIKTLSLHVKSDDEEAMEIISN